MVWAVGSHPLRAYGTGGISLFRDHPPGRTTMDNYAVIYEFPNDVGFTFSHIYFDPPGFSGTKARVFGSEGAVDLAAAATIGRTNKGERKLEAPEAGQDATYFVAGGVYRECAWPEEAAEQRGIGASFDAHRHDGAEILLRAEGGCVGRGGCLSRAACIGNLGAVPK